MYNYSARAKELAMELIERRNNDLRIMPYHYHQLAVEIFSDNSDLLCEALGADNRRFSVFAPVLLKMLDPGEFNYDFGVIQESILSYARNAIDDLIESLDERYAGDDMHSEHYGDMAEYNRGRI